MGTLFDIIAALHPDLGCHVYSISIDPVTHLPKRETDEIAFFGARRNCEREWIEAFVRFQNSFAHIPATVRMIEIDPEEENTIDVFVELGSDILNRAGSGDPLLVNPFSI